MKPKRTDEEIVRRTLTRLFGIMILSVAFCARISAQVDTGTVSGTVLDQSGAVVPNAKVTIRNTGTGLGQEVTTDRAGLYVSLPLYAGEYDIEVEAQQFSREVQHLTLTVAERRVADFTLQVGPVAQEVSVQGAAAALQTESTTLSNLQSERNIDNLPLNGPNFAQLMGLVAGVMPAQTQSGTEGGSVPITMKRGVIGYSVNGQSYFMNNFLVDGILNNENHNGLGIVIYPPVDAIAEFREETSVADAQYGRTAGGTINLIYKSGTSRFHGTLFEYVRNSSLDARNFFDAAIPEFRRNEFGATVGGPLVPGKNPKTFFFADYQGVRTRRGQTFLSTVPIPAARGGDFSAYPEEIYDPLTQVTLSNGEVQRTQFPGNIIPSDRIDVVGHNIISLYPSPNLLGLTNNFIFSPVFKDTENDGDIRVDHTFSDEDSAWVRYSVGRYDNFAPGALPAPAVGGGSPTGTHHQPVDQAVVSETHVFSSRTVNQARFGMSYLGLRSTGQDYGQYFGLQLGIPGSQVQGDLLTSGLPEFSISGFKTLGENGFTPAVLVSNDFQWNDDVTMIRGRHTLKGGIQALRLRYNAFQSSSARGDMTFSKAFTSNPASPAATGLGAADLLLGRPISGSIEVFTGDRGFRRSEISGYFQDTFKATSKLTFNLGLRYENYIGWPWTEVYNRMYQWVPSQQTVLQVGTNGIPSSGVYGLNDNFAPRVGLAYRFRPTTVIRAAAGTFYSVPQWDITVNLAANPPSTVNTAFTNNEIDFVDAQPASAGFSRPAVGVIPGSALFGVDPHAKTSTNYQWNAAVEQRLSASILFTVAYVGVVGIHQSTYYGPDGIDINQAIPGNGPIAQRRPFASFQSITYNENSLNTSYNGLQITGERRFSKGLSFLVSYTYSHSIDNLTTGVYDTYDFHLSRGNSDYDVPNRLALSGTYALPFSPQGWLRYAAAGWQVNGILSLYGGLPFEVDAAENTLNNGYSSWAQRICNGKLANPTIQAWYNLSCFEDPAYEQWGNGGRNILRGPNTRQLDFSIFKKFPIGADKARAFEFRAESFNLFNRPQFNLPDNTFDDGTGGVISSAGAPLTYQRTSREIQLGLKFYW